MTLFTTILIVCGKVNFSNLSQYSTLNEKTYRRQFEQAFDFIGLNLSIAEAATATGQLWIGVMDSSFIRKSGKTFGLDWYYNGSASRAEKGLEVSLIGMVNAETGQSYAVSVEQTCRQSDFPELSRIDQVLDLVTASACSGALFCGRWRLCQGKVRYGDAATQVAYLKQTQMRCQSALLL